MNHKIGNVAMHKDFTRKEACNLIRRNPAVRTSYPEILRTLLIREFLEKLRIIGCRLFSPATIIFEKMFHGDRFYRSLQKTVCAL